MKKLTAAIMAFCVITVLSVYPASAAVSSADVSPTDLYFTRVQMVPANVDVPYFYKEVGNIAGMYVFTMPDGTVVKRIYGALDGEYGWYEPVGASNTVPRDAPMLDSADDVKAYETALLDAGMTDDDTQDYFGILPPEDGVPSLRAIFGWAPRFIFFICGAVTALLCLMILGLSALIRNKKK